VQVCLSDVSADQVWRILRKRQIHLQRRRSWCISTDPEFGPKAADVVGLHPDLQLVISQPRDVMSIPNPKLS
jgi:hypothetical protein